MASIDWFQEDDPKPSARARPKTKLPTWATEEEEWNEPDDIDCPRYGTTVLDIDDDGKPLPNPKPRPRDKLSALADVDSKGERNDIEQVPSSLTTGTYGSNRKVKTHTYCITPDHEVVERTERCKRHAAARGPKVPATGRGPAGSLRSPSARSPSPVATTQQTVRWGVSDPV
jgi:hypothetical protein